MTWRYDLLVMMVCILCLLSLSGGPATSTKQYSILFMGEGDLDHDTPIQLWRMLKDAGLQVEVFNETRLGHDSWEYLQFAKANLQRFQNLRPDVVIIHLGYPDVSQTAEAVPSVKFYNSVLSLIRLSKTILNQLGQPSILMIGTLPPVPQGSAFPPYPVSNRRIRAEINPMIRDLARRERIVCVEMEPIFIADRQQRSLAMARTWYHALMPYLGIHSAPTLKEIWSGRFTWP